MTTNHPAKPIRLPSSVIRELEKVEALDFSENLPGLLKWVNAVVSAYVPEVDEAGSGRVSPAFTPRSFRHYQTLGCIDPPQKLGKEARYGFRHYLQALLIRKLLWERVPAERIRALLDSRTNADYKAMLFCGVELVAKAAAHTSTATAGIPGETLPTPAAWMRVAIAPGVELHLREHTKRPKPAELKQWISLLETALRKNL